MTFPPALDPIRSLGASFRLLGRSVGPLLLGGLILAISQGPHVEILFGDWDAHEFKRELPGRLLFGGCCGLFGLLVWSWIGVGFAHAVEETRRQGTSALASLFDARGRFGDVLLALFLHTLAWIVGCMPFAMIGIGATALGRHTGIPDAVIVLAAIGGILVYLPVLAYVLLGLAFVPQEVMLGGRPALDSFWASWELARGKRLALFVYHLALFVFSALGFCLCLVGVLFTSAVAILSTFESWLELTRPAGGAPQAFAMPHVHAPAPPAFDAPPPPPPTTA